MTVDIDIQTYRGRPVEDLGIPPTVARALREATIRTIGGLTLYGLQELAELCGLDENALTAIESAMERLGLYLAGRAPEPETAAFASAEATGPTFGGRVEVQVVTAAELPRAERRERRRGRVSAPQIPATVPSPMGFGGIAMDQTYREATRQMSEIGADYFVREYMVWRSRAEKGEKALAELKDEEAKKDGVLVLARARIMELERALAAAREHVCQPQAQISSRPHSAPDAHSAVQADAELAEMSLLLRQAEAERDAAFRGKEATRAFYAERLRRAGVVEVDPKAEGVRVVDLLDADTICGVLDQAQAVCTMLRLTCDRDAAGKLDHDVSAPAVRTRLAVALATMQEYAAAKSAALARGRSAGAGLANLRAFCADPCSGAQLSAHQVCLIEAEEVSKRPKMRSARTLPMPDELGGGTAVMNAHIRIGSGKPPAPRLHYLDDTGASGLIVVGWVGGHLLNTITN